MIETNGIKLDITSTADFIKQNEITDLAPAVNKAAAELTGGTCPGSEYLGWLNLPEEITDSQLTTIEESAERAREKTKVYVVVGIGGSYLGSKAVLDALGGVDEGFGGSVYPEIAFAGTGLCSSSMNRVLSKVTGTDFRICVISKSGTTLEPALAFRMLREVLQERFGPVEAARRVVAITDAKRGALRQLALDEGYEIFEIPANVGGRFSVLTPVGLVPLAVAGVDIRALVAGAKVMRQACLTEDIMQNPAHLYAAVRYGLYKKGFTTEVMSSFNSDLQTLQEWWKQLFGESEGKQGNGIFPASTVFTTDLHSLGQYIQDGRRSLQETFMSVRNGVSRLKVPGGEKGSQNLDGLDYLSGRTMDEINWKAYEGTRNAHVAGGVPCSAFELDSLSAETVGGLIYLFEKAVGIGGRLLDVNPFDQPGVEMYKQEMFRLLGKPK